MTLPVKDSTAWEIVVNHGQYAGKIQETRTTIRAGKNIGRSNETTPQQQAESEAESKWLKQRDKGYSEQRGVAINIHKPMLAHKYHEHYAKVDFADAYVQPKLNGQRCIAVRNGDEVTLTSRNGKSILTMDHIRVALLGFMRDGDIWDGELYLHGTPLNEIESAIKKLTKKSLVIQYHVYDSISSDVFVKRVLSLTSAICPANGHTDTSPIRLVETCSVDSHENVLAYREKCESLGYEGAMVRFGSLPYQSDTRSYSLLKVKKFVDDEFLIVDVIPDGVARPNLGKFVCQTADGADFKVVPEGTAETREAYLRDREALIGKMLTVRYFEMTKTAKPVPQFGVGISIREDL